MQDGRSTSRSRWSRIVLALTTNSVSKAFVALAFARRRDRLSVWGGLAALVLAAWAGLLLFG